MKKPLFVFGAIFLASCTHSSETWVGFFYPSGSTEDATVIEEFADKEACVRWANTLLAGTKNEDAHFVCGFDCEFDAVGQHSCSFNYDPDNLTVTTIRVFCGENKTECEADQEIPSGFTHQWGQVFENDGDVYLSLLRSEDVDHLDGGEWCVLKNDEELFCDQMYAATEGPIDNVRVEKDGLVIEYFYMDEAGEVSMKHVRD